MRSKRIYTSNFPKILLVRLATRQYYAISKYAKKSGLSVAAVVRYVIDQHII